MDIYTNWSQATKNINIAILAVLSASKANRKAWIELRENGDQSFPIMIPNPVLNDHFKWTMSYGIPNDELSLNNYNFINATEEDLAKNYVACFASHDVIDEYKKTGIIPDNVSGMGICFPKKRTKDDLSWTYYWKPIDNIPYRIPDPNVGLVFTVCTTDEDSSEINTLIKIEKFIHDYICILQNK
jgi:hypothetical protein